MANCRGGPLGAAGAESCLVAKGRGGATALVGATFCCCAGGNGARMVGTEAEGMFLSLFFGPLPVRRRRKEENEPDCFAGLTGAADCCVGMKELFDVGIGGARTSGIDGRLRSVRVDND
jgi:hypothetical protein